MSLLDSPRPIGTITGEVRTKAAIRSLKDYGLAFTYEPAEPISDPEWHVLVEQVQSNLRGEHGPGYQAASQHVIELERALPPEPITTKHTAQELPVDDDTTKKRPAYERDHLWLRWHEDDGLSELQIRDKWNNLDENERRVISPTKFQSIDGGNSGRSIVYNALVRARKENG